MKRFLFAALCALPFLGTSQDLVLNAGGTIVVQSGAVLYIEGGISNTAGSTIDNFGTIEVKGNFTNAGTWINTHPANILKFSGGVNSNVTSGSAVFQNVVIQKDAGFNVNLADSLTIDNNLNFNSTGASKVVLGNFSLKLGTAATVTGDDADEYVVTSGLGMMQKAVNANGSFTFPIGDDVTDYSPLSCTYTGSAYSSAKLRARVNDATHPNKPADATDFISRNWDLDAGGITGYNNTLVGTYLPADVTGTASLVKGAVYSGSTWTYAGAAGGSNTVTGSTNQTAADFTGTNFFGKAILKVFLSGALPVAGPPMTTTINSVLPLASPYSAAPWNAPAVTAPSIPALATDWILVETRDPSINIISQTSGFLMKDGTIVNPDGSALTLKNAVASAIISIRHRNHLGIRTINPLDLVNPSLWDFSTGTGQAYTNTTVAPIPPNANMRLIGSTYALWGGNASITTGPNTPLLRVNYAGPGNDNAALIAALGGNIGNTLGIPTIIYHQCDLNLNGVVRYAGPLNDNAIIIQNLGGNIGNTIIQHL